MATIVEGNQKAPFSIAFDRSVGKGATPFPGLLHFTLDTYLVLMSIKEVTSTIFKVFGMTQLEIEPRSPGPLSNTLPTRSTNYLYLFKGIIAYRGLLSLLLLLLLVVVVVVVVEVVVVTSKLITVYKQLIIRYKQLL